MTIERNGGEPESDQQAAERLAAELDMHSADTGEIADISKISRATWEGRSATDIIAEYGGLEGVERQIGSDAARELEERAVREEKDDIESQEKGDN
ncbi:MAG TPA: hypothetical protein VLE72_02925 [Candidatus Saccharimonadales bacterium]|nr:hypothetical protein [Candidatus Saccharimonadales bacterium]